MKAKEGLELQGHVIREFAMNEYEKNIRFWVGQNLPKRTYTKLKNFFATNTRRLKTYLLQVSKPKKDF